MGQLDRMGVSLGQPAKVRMEGRHDGVAVAVIDTTASPANVA